MNLEFSGKEAIEVTLTLSQQFPDAVEWSPVHSLSPVVVGLVRNPRPQQLPEHLDKNADSGVFLRLVLPFAKLHVKTVEHLVEVFKFLLGDKKALAHVYNVPLGRDL